MIELNVNEIVIKRGDIIYVKLQGKGSCQSNIRPAVCISNQLNNIYAPTLQVCPITSKVKNNLPIHVYLGSNFGLSKTSTLLAEQICTIDKKEQIIGKVIGHVDESTLKKIEKAITIQLSMNHIAGVKDCLLTTKMDKQLKRGIIKLLKTIRNIEELISSTENDMFIKIALQERELKLIKLKSICDYNGFDYEDFYERYDKNAV